MTFDVDEFLDDYTLPSEQVPVCAKAGLLAEHARIEAQILDIRSRSGLAGPPAELVAKLEQLEADIEESVKVFTLTARTYQDWADLMAAHPPTKEQKAKGHASNPDTFEPSALAACATEPPVTVEQAARMRQTLPPSEWHALMEAVARLHQEQVTAPKSLLLSVVHQASAASSAMSLLEDSLAAPSSDGSAAQ